MATASFEKRKQRVRNSLAKKSNGRIRLSVHRSNSYIYAQLIDDTTSTTLASAYSGEKELASKFKGSAKNIEAAKLVGQLIAKRGAEKKVKEVVFDRGGCLYHGRVKALAEAAREAGLKF